jgi:hypothetical protein
LIKFLIKKSGTEIFNNITSINFKSNNVLNFKYKTCFLYRINQNGIQQIYDEESFRKIVKLNMIVKKKVVYFLISVLQILQKNEKYLPFFFTIINKIYFPYFNLNTTIDDLIKNLTEKIQKFKKWISKGKEIIFFLPIY